MVAQINRKDSICKSDERRPRGCVKREKNGLYRKLSLKNDLLLRNWSRLEVWKESGLVMCVGRSVVWLPRSIAKNSSENLIED